MGSLSRRDFLSSSLGAGLSLAAHSAYAKNKKTVFMILWRGETEVEDGFKTYFKDQGMPLEIKARSLDRNMSRLPDILDEIRMFRPDLVYSWGTSVTLGVAGRDPELMEGPDDFPPQVTERPIIFTMVSQPVRSHIIKRFGPTGRNLTGVSHLVPLKTQLEAMRAYMPVDRVAVIYTPTETNSVLVVEQLTELGRRLNIRIDRYPVKLRSDEQPDPDSIADLIAQAAANGPQFLYLGPDSFIGQYAKNVTNIANAHGLPSFASVERMLSGSDALYGLVAPYVNIGRLTAMKASRILYSGDYAGDIPVEILPEFSYIIRADVARKLQIFPRLSLLDYAQVIES